MSHVHSSKLSSKSLPPWTNLSGHRPANQGKKTPGGANADDLRTHKTFAKAGTISPYAVPERWMFVGELDKTSVGKIDKKRLRERYGDQ